MITNVSSGDGSPRGRRIEDDNDKLNDFLNSNLTPEDLAITMISESVQISRDTAQVHAKNMQANALIQSALIAEESQINYVTLQQAPIKDGQPDITAMTTTNTEIGARRGDYENRLNMVRQDAQLSETNLNSTVNLSEQSIQLAGNLIDTVGNNLTNLITKI
jgi:hypothetical protein